MSQYADFEILGSLVGPFDKTPCGYRFLGGGVCLTTSEHPIHHGAWEKVHGLENNHPYERLERRSGRPGRRDDDGETRP